MPKTVVNFVRTALERAEKALDVAELNWFSFAGENVGFVETEPQIVNWISGQFDEPHGTGARIFCDSSGWHLGHSFLPSDLHHISPMALDQILAEVGLFGSYNAPSNRWDLFDPVTQIGLRLLPNLESYPVWESTAPMANLLGWIARSKGQMVMHVASLGSNGQGVLLAGPGGSGKSGTTLAGIANGLQSVGDDYCVISSNDRITARPFYRSMKQDTEGLARVGIHASIGSVQKNWQGKHVFDLREFFPNAATNELDIRAILLPSVTKSDQSSILLATQFETLQALAPSTMLQLDGDRSATFGACADVVRRVPGYHLSLSERPTEIAATIAAFIEGTGP